MFTLSFNSFLSYRGWEVLTGLQGAAGDLLQFALLCILIMYVFLYLGITYIIVCCNIILSGCFGLFGLYGGVRVTLYKYFAGLEKKEILKTCPLPFSHPGSNNVSNPQMTLPNSILLTILTARRPMNTEQWCLPLSH